MSQNFVETAAQNTAPQTNRGTIYAAANYDPSHPNRETTTRRVMCALGVVAAASALYLGNILGVIPAAEQPNPHIPTYQQPINRDPQQDLQRLLDKFAPPTPAAQPVFVGSH